MTEDEKREAFERLYQRLFRFRTADTVHYADCEDVFNAALEWERSREKWISVEDSLPEINEPVLVPGGVAHRANMTSTVWVWWSDMANRMIEWQVKVWRPLPPSPKENP